MNLKWDTRLGVFNFDAGFYPLVVFVVGILAAYIFLGRNWEVLFPIIPLLVVTLTMAVLPGLLRLIVLIAAGIALFCL